MAIINPYSKEIMQAYYAFRTLKGLDDNCQDYVAFVETLPKEHTTIVVDVQKDSNVIEYKSDLQRAIIKGQKEEATALTKKLLENVAPLDIVNEEIIPALNKVGVDYENKKVYLPQLLMSAEASKCAFLEIKEKMQGQKTEDKGIFVIATVKGDIHDIGKNIVKLLLENYGFNVVDLGKDVEPKTVVEKVVELHAPIVGLSALMTTTVPAMEKTIKLLRKSAPWCKVMVGGAVLNKEYAKLIGADYYAKDGMEGVRYAMEIVGKEV